MKTNRARQVLLGALFVLSACALGCGGAQNADLRTDTVVLPAEKPPAASTRGFDDGLVRQSEVDVGPGTSEPIAFRAWSLGVEEQARRVQKPMLVYVRADWCTACVMIERETFADERVRRAATAYLPVQIDVTEDSPSSNALLERFGVRGLPCVLVAHVEGTSASPKLVPGECLASSDVDGPALADALDAAR